MSEWISVKERLPDLREVYKGSPLESGDVLIFQHYVTIGRFGETYGKRKRRWTDARQYVCKPTHWMPLPEPPK